MPPSRNSAVPADPVYRCVACDVYYFEERSPPGRQRPAKASYIDLSLEQRWRWQRCEFFTYLLDLVRKHLATGSEHPLLLDVGCSFGHLIELANQTGFRAMGLEVDEELLCYAKSKGLLVVRKWNEVPSQLDAITFVDSFYYLLNPNEVLQQVADKLQAGGVALFRVTNRNWAANLMSALWNDPALSILGDARYSYSRKSLKALVRQAGLSELALLPDEGRGRHLSRRKEIAYRILNGATGILRGMLILAPGIIMLATPAPVSGRVTPSQEYAHRGLPP